MDVFVRRLIGRHLHVTRKMGFSGAIVRSFDRVADDPTDYHMVKNSTSELWKYPKDLFKLYKSATLHVVKPRLPKKVIIFSTIALAGLLFAAYVLITYAGKVQDGTIVPGVEVAEQKVTELKEDTSAKTDLSFTTVEEYIELITPLSPIAPWTAPIYEEVRTVQQVPGKLACIDSANKGCRCFTDQMTRVHLERRVCMALIEEGIYSPYHQPYAAAGAGTGPAAGSGTYPPTSSSSLAAPVVHTPSQ